MSLLRCFVKERDNKKDNLFVQCKLISLLELFALLC